MTHVRMHVDEIDLDAALVRQLLRAQMPEWADLPIARVASSGTDNAMFRLGDDMVVRMPRIERAVPRLDNEQRWLPVLASAPSPRDAESAREGRTAARATPGSGRSTRGSRATTRSTPRFDDLAEAAREHRRARSTRCSTSTTVARRRASRDAAANRCRRPNNRRGRAIEEPHEPGRRRRRHRRVGGGIASLGVGSRPGLVPWRHRPGNLLVHGGRSVHAVIDFGSIGVGDPACDLVIAWDLFDRTHAPGAPRSGEVDDAHVGIGAADGPCAPHSGRSRTTCTRTRRWSPRPGTSSPRCSQRRPEQGESA